MDRVHLMSIFIAVADDQSFAAAAARLGVSPSSVTRAILRLEEIVGAKLVTRTTRSVRLTEAGQRYLDDVRLVMTKIAETQEMLANVNSVPKGHIDITASMLFGATYVTPCIVEYLQRFPEMTVSTYFLDRVVNIVEEDWDLALRVGRMADPGLVAIRVGEVRRVICASPHYLASNGVPQSPEELTHHTIVAATGISPDVNWKFGLADEWTVDVTPRLVVTSNDAAIEAATLGIGLTRILSYQIAGQLADGRLEIVLAEFEGLPLPVHLLYRGEKCARPAIREFIDLLVERLGSDPGLH